MKVTDPVSGVYGEAWSTIKCRGEAFDGGLILKPTRCQGAECSACGGNGYRTICAWTECIEHGCSMQSCTTKKIEVNLG